MGDFGGHILAAVGIDGENAMYPIAYEIVDVDNKSIWNWFLELLVDDIGVGDSQWWTFISDKQKGFIDALDKSISELFSSSPMPQNVPRPPTASVSRALPTSVIAKADDVIDNPILEKVTGRVNEINLHSVSQDDQVSRMTDVNWKENANKKWSDLFKS
ncbi:putative transposase [Abeliophyllum distichum]|uniref:Transposase n=1 Tax=Abeliophyllum distichum TaxID=126358 RepID=A0ABD1UNR3_9LAMI